MSCHAVARLALWGVGVLCVMCADLSEDFKRHNKMVSGFPCRLPQPRVFYLQELVSAGEWKAKYEAMVHLHQVRIPRDRDTGYWQIVYTAIRR